MAEGGLVDGVAAPVRPGRTGARPDGEDDAVSVSGAHDRVVGLGWAVDEVPRAEGALLAFDDQQRLAGENEEVLLVRFPVVHRHRLTRPEDPQVDADLREMLLALEDADGAATGRGPPWRVAGVDDKPAVLLGHEAVVGRLEGRFGRHAANSLS